MSVYVALLRAVNVGGTGKFPMSELKAMCEAEGFEDVATYIASGNVVFASDQKAGQVKAALEARLADYAGKPAQVFIRTAEEMAGVLADNPFAGEKPSYTLAIFLDDTPEPDIAQTAKHRTDERIAVGKREIYVFHPSGMGRSKLTLPAAKAGTGRNMNTVAKLVEMAKARG